MTIPMRAGSIRRSAAVLATVLVVTSCGTVQDGPDASAPPAAPEFQTVDPADVEQLDRELNRDFDFCGLVAESELGELGLLSGSGERQGGDDGCLWTGPDGLLLQVTGQVLGPGDLDQLESALQDPARGIRPIDLGDRSGLLVPGAPGTCQVLIPGDGPVGLTVSAGSETTAGEREFCPLTQRAAELVAARLP